MSLSTVFAVDPPTLVNGSVSFPHTANNEYYIDYSDFVIPGDLCVHWGAGYIDLNTRTRELDPANDCGNFVVKTQANCSYIKFIPEFIGLPGTTSYFEFPYLITDGPGNRSNIGHIRVAITWEAFPSVSSVDPCN